jgi:hypothetical protein
MACRALQQQGDERKGQLAWNNLTRIRCFLFLPLSPNLLAVSGDLWDQVSR